MAQVRWSEEALADVGDIHSFIARDSQAAAELLVERIHDAALRLRDFPDMGRLIPDDPLSRAKELVIPPFRLIYERHGDEIRILAVIHSARQVRPGDFGG